MPLRRPIIVALSIALCALQARLWFGNGSVLVNERLQSQVANAQAIVKTESRRNAALGADVADLEKGGEAIEARARSELGMVRKGETFYLIVHRD